MRTCACSVGFSLVLGMLLAGCQPKNTFVRDKTTKVTGVLLIDGKPEPLVNIRMNRVGTPDESAGTSKLLTASGMTDNEGKFVIGTYDKGLEGDGAADGEYVLTFQWGQINLIGGRYEGDKFKGKYADPTKSVHKVEVAGEPVDLGLIELESAPEAESNTEADISKLAPISGEVEAATKAKTPPRPRGKKNKD